MPPRGPRTGARLPDAERVAPDAPLVPDALACPGVVFWVAACWAARCWAAARRAASAMAPDEAARRAGLPAGRGGVAPAGVGVPAGVSVPAGTNFWVVS